MKRIYNSWNAIWKKIQRSKRCSNLSDCRYWYTQSIIIFPDEQKIVPKNDIPTNPLTMIVGAEGAEVMLMRLQSCLLNAILKIFWV